MDTLRRFLNWRVVRSVGELQILTRASYIMLIVVPLLAGTWPTVRIVINSYNRFLEESATRLDKAANALASQATAAKAAAQIDNSSPSASETINRSAERIRELAVSVEEELARLKREATLSPFLPHSWALAFFAALAVVLGQVVYQSGAPAIVRQQTPNDFVRTSIQAYRDSPSVGSIKRYDDEMRRGYSGPFRFELEMASDELLRARTAKPIDPQSLERAEVGFVGAAARVQYERAAESNIHFVVPAMLLYGTGILILLYIMYQQSMAVAASTGWIAGSTVR